MVDESAFKLVSSLATVPRGDSAPSRSGKRSDGLRGVKGTTNATNADRLTACRSVESIGKSNGRILCRRQLTVQELAGEYGVSVGEHLRV